MSEQPASRGESTARHVAQIVAAAETASEALVAAAQERAEQLIAEADGEARARARELINEARTAAEEVLLDGEQLSGHLRELSDSLRINASRLLRDISNAHSELTARLDHADPDRPGLT